MNEQDSYMLRLAAQDMLTRLELHIKNEVTRVADALIQADAETQINRRELDVGRDR